MLNKKDFKLNGKPQDYMVVLVFKDRTQTNCIRLKFK